tara:strand:+ start:234 stop:797 length:564 start_codon:yes stop_codon:yes gene_type:complete
MRLLIILFFISFSSFSQTKEIDELRQIWLDEVFEYDEVIIKDGIDWSESFTPYVLNSRDVPSAAANAERRWERFLSKLELKTGTYSFQKDVKDTNNREMAVSSTARIATGRYFIDLEITLFRDKFYIYDTYNNNDLVGSSEGFSYSKSYLAYSKAYNKYFRKNKIDRRKKESDYYVIWEEILKRYRN